mgnify:CR=1 FL=1
MNKNNWIVLLILCIWFVISFVTNILGPMLPMIIDSFGLSLTLAAFLPFSFFLAYGIMSIPAGMIIERFGGKISLLVAFSLAFLGAGLFVMFPTYPIVLTSLFAIGLGMAMLQVIILPLMREAGGEKKYAFNQVLAQIVFGAASFMSPFVLAGLMRKLTGEDSANDFFIRFLKGITPESLPWSSLYFIFTIVFVIMLVVISYVKFPKVELKEDEKAGTVQNYKEYRLCGNRARIGELDESFPEYVSWGQPGRSRGYYGCLVLGIDVHRLLVGIGDRKVNRLKADVTYFLDDSDP